MTEVSPQLFEVIFQIARSIAGTNCSDERLRARLRATQKHWSPHTEDIVAYSTQGLKLSTVAPLLNESKYENAWQRLCVSTDMSDFSHQLSVLRPRVAQAVESLLDEHDFNASPMFCLTERDDDPIADDAFAMPFLKTITRVAVLGNIGAHIQRDTFKYQSIQALFTSSRGVLYHVKAYNWIHPSPTRISPIVLLEHFKTQEYFLTLLGILNYTLELSPPEQRETTQQAIDDHNRAFMTKSRQGCHNASCKRNDTKIFKLMACSRCRKVRYCSGECQKADWATHKKVCKSAK